MKPKFKNQSVRLMYDLYQEFDQGELNSALDAYRDNLSHDEQMGNHIIFCYIDMITENHPLDLTYATLTNLPEALNDLYDEFTQKYLPKKAMDQLTKILAAYLTVLALNMHDLNLSVKETDEGTRWGSRYQIAVNDEDFLPVITAHTTLDDDAILIDMAEISSIYKQVTGTSLDDYLENITLSKKVS